MPEIILLASKSQDACCHQVGPAVIEGSPYLYKQELLPLPILDKQILYSSELLKVGTQGNLLT